jgi:hypothetical protein
MSIDLGDTPTEARELLIRGVATVDIVDGVPEEYIAASAKAFGPDQVTEFERQARPMYDQMARIAIEPVWARFFDFGTGRMPSFLTKLQVTSSRTVDPQRRDWTRADRARRLSSFFIAPDDRQAEPQRTDEHRCETADDRRSCASKHHVGEQDKNAYETDGEQHHPGDREVVSEPH